MLPRAHRVVRSAEFRSVVRRGRRAGSRLLVVHAARTGDHAARFGYVVGSAVGNAVTRNRVRRRLRAASAELLPVAGSGVAVVVRALPPAADASWAELRCELHGLARATGVTP